MRLAALLLVVVAVGAGTLGAIHAQPPAGAPRVCAPTNSEIATVTAIATDPAAWIGKCVSVEAIYAGEQLHADADAIYGVNANSIGGYVDGRGDVGGAWRGTFTGRVADCATAEEDLLTGLLRSPGISLHGRTLGCPGPKGPFLVFMSQGELKPAGIKRRLPGAKGGDLAPDEPEGVVTQLAADLAIQFEAAMRSGDAADLTRVIGNAYQAEQLMTRDDTAFAGLKRGAVKELRVFGYRSSSREHESAEACWCLKPDCAKLWPIHGRDADNQPTRPYACIRVDVIPFPGSETSSRWRIDASNDVYGLDEP